MIPKYITMMMLVLFCSVQAKEFKVGVAKTAITPSVGTDMSGFLARQNPSEGVLDDVYTKAVILSDGKIKVAIVTADILGFDGDEVQIMKKEIKRKTGISNILFCASHTHSGPAIITLCGCGNVDPEFKKEFKKKIVDTVIKANSLFTPVTVNYGLGYGDISMNRRNSYAKNTTYGVDSEISILRFDKPDGTPVCLLVNYACHAVILSSNNRKFSRDYPGVVQDTLEQKYNCQVMFLQGAAGDINPKESGTVEIMRKLALSLCEQIENTSLKPLQNTNLQAKSIPVQFPVQLLSTTEIDSCINLTITTNTTFQEKYRNAMMDWKNMIHKTPDYPYIKGEVMKLHIGELSLIGVSGELFSHIGREIKDYYSPNPVMVLGYTNGNAGYLPTRYAFSEGGYEVDMAYRYYGRKGPFTPDLEDIILKAAKPQ